MREIRFRGREVIGNQRKLGDWVYGDLVLYCGGYERTVDDETAPVVTEICIEQNGCLHEVDPNTVGQFTGLKDSEGREIYEGDIIQIVTKNPYWGFKKNFVVEWGLDGWIIDGDPLYSWFELHDLKVIGNVYDNPELLNETNPVD